MSSIGSKQNVGKQYNIYCTNLTVSQLKTYKGLPSNAIIISSPTNNDTDKGIPSILMTDYQSNVLPLTYVLDKTVFTVNENTNTASLNTYYLNLADRIGRIENALRNKGML